MGWDAGSYPEPQNSIKGHNSERVIIKKPEYNSNETWQNKIYLRKWEIL